jgi:hypothetical protein
VSLEGAYPGGPTVVTCDGCGTSIEVEARTEHRAVEQAEREGWRFPDDTDRCYCPDHEVAA